MSMRTTLVCVALTANFALTYRVMAADGDCASTDPAVAIPACTQAIDAAAATGGRVLAAAYYDRGMAHLAQYSRKNEKSNADARTCFEGGGDEKLAACSRLIDNPEAEPGLRSRALFERSQLMSVLGRGAEAIADFKRNMDDFPPAVSESYDNAVADFTKAIERDAKNANALTQRGDLRLARQEDGLALADFNKAIAADPKQMMALFGRAYIRNERGDPVGAVADYKAILALPATSDQEKWMQEQAKQIMPTIGAD